MKQLQWVGSEVVGTLLIRMTQVSFLIHSSVWTLLSLSFVVLQLPGNKQELVLWRG